MYNLIKLLENLPISELEYGINFENIEIHELEDKLESLEDVNNNISRLINEINKDLSSKKKHLSGVTINGKELTNEEHLEHVCSKLTYGINYVEVEDIDNKYTLSECEGMLEETINRCENLLTDIKNRIEELEEESNEE